jgi:hypothetical protein
MARFPMICGVVFGILGWIAIKSGMFPMPEDDPRPGQPHSFLYNLGFGGISFLFFVVGFVVGAVLEHLYRSTFKGPKK